MSNYNRINFKERVSIVAKDAGLVQHMTVHNTVTVVFRILAKRQRKPRLCVILVKRRIRRRVSTTSTII